MPAYIFRDISETIEEYQPHKKTPWDILDDWFQSRNLGVVLGESVPAEEGEEFDLFIEANRHLTNEEINEIETLEFKCIQKPGEIAHA